MARIAVETVAAFLREHPALEATFCCFSSSDLDVYRKSLAEIPMSTLDRAIQDNMDIRQLPVFGDRDRERLAKYHRTWKRLTG